LKQRGLPVEPVADKNFPPIERRLGKARPYMNMGLVTLAPPCVRTRTFRGVTRDFLREVMENAMLPDSNPLAIALATAVLFAFSGEPTLPSGLANEQAPPPPQAPPALPTIFLTSGRHEIDGHVVDIPYQGGSYVEYGLEAGRHVIDSKIVHVHRPFLIR
jgi:hypothetical protein